VSFGQDFNRRDFVRALGLAAAGLSAGGTLSASERLAGLGPQLAARSPQLDPEVPNQEIARILKELFGDRPIRSGNKGNISLDMPAVAEDGRVVPVIIESNLPMKPDNYVKGIHLIVDHNPDPHLAAFHLTPAMGAVSIQTRIKMKRTTWVRAILETSTGDVWADYARVNVTLNGCG
jgi:sulfur-oxidizing protein SoxY